MGLSCFSNRHPVLFIKCGTPGYVAPEILAANNKIDYDE